MQRYGMKVVCGGFIGGTTVGLCELNLTATSGSGNTFKDKHT